MTVKGMAEESFKAVNIYLITGDNLCMVTWLLSYFESYLEEQGFADNGKCCHILHLNVLTRFLRITLIGSLRHVV